MNYKLDKLVGRDPLPGDEVAFDRVTRLFARARQVQPVSKKAIAHKSRLGDKLTVDAGIVTKTGRLKKDYR